MKNSYEKLQIQLLKWKWNKVQRNTIFFSLACEIWFFQKENFHAAQLWTAKNEKFSAAVTWDFSGVSFIHFARDRRGWIGSIKTRKQSKFSLCLCFTLVNFSFDRSPLALVCVFAWRIAIKFTVARLARHSICEQRHTFGRVSWKWDDKFSNCYFSCSFYGKCDNKELSIEIEQSFTILSNW